MLLEPFVLDVVHPGLIVRVPIVSLVYGSSQCEVEGGLAEVKWLSVVLARVDLRRKCRGVSSEDKSVITLLINGEDSFAVLHLVLETVIGVLKSVEIPIVLDRLHVCPDVLFIIIDFVILGTSTCGRVAHVASTIPLENFGGGDTNCDGTSNGEFN